ncbi:MAG TPA: META domain-containing protein [Burkholderiaceae bacterium]|nr:META domain-containing protein [Burkholderiaceae bacterium]
MRIDTRLEARLGVAVLVTLLALVAGCTMVGGGSGGSGAGSAGGGLDAGGGSARDTLDGTAWIVTRLHGARPETPSSPAPTMRFEHGRVAGSDGCNRYSAGYRSAGDSFGLLGNMVGTKRMCPDEQMRTARAFTAALNDARALRHEGGRLLLLDGSGAPVMTLARDSQELANTRWRVTGYNNGRQAVVSTISGTELTMDFGADGRVSGSAGCNDFTAGYRQDGDRLSITAPASTRRACARPEGVMAQEASFLGALAMVDRTRIEGGQLELRSAGGELAVTLERVDAR